VESIGSPSGLYVESCLGFKGLDQESIRSLSGVHQDSLIVYKGCYLERVQMDSRKTPDGLLIQFQEFTWTPDGVHQDSWLSVMTSSIGADPFSQYFTNGKQQ
jgi:hypothetical protein